MIEAALGRLGAMKSGLLAPALYERMLAAPDEARAREIVGRTVYAPALRRAGEGAPPAAVERALWAEVFSAWARLVKFLEGGPARLARLVPAAFEAENVRRTVRRILAGASGGDAPPLGDLGGLAEASPEGLRRAQTVEEVGGILAHTPYARAFERASHRLSEGAALFDFEQTLEVGCREALLSAACAMRGGQGAGAYVSGRQHLLNLRWALRLRFGRGMTPDEARQFLVQSAEAGEQAEVGRVLSCETLSDAREALRHLVVGAALEHAGPGALDRALARAAARRARRELRRSFMRFPSLLAYFDVRAQEVRDLAAILVGHRQGRRAEDIRPCLGLAA